MAMATVASARDLPVGYWYFSFFDFRLSPGGGLFMVRIWYFGTSEAMPLRAIRPQGGSDRLFMAKLWDPELLDLSSYEL